MNGSDQTRRAGNDARSQIAAVQALATMIAAADTGTITAADLRVSVRSAEG